MIYKAPKSESTESGRKFCAMECVMAVQVAVKYKISQLVADEAKMLKCQLLKQLGFEVDA